MLSEVVAQEEMRDVRIAADMRHQVHVEGMGGQRSLVGEQDGRPHQRPEQDQRGGQRNQKGVARSRNWASLNGVCGHRDYPAWDGPEAKPPHLNRR